MLIVAGVNVWPSAVSDVVANFHPRTTGAMQIVLMAPPPKVEPPLPVQVEYGSEATDLNALKDELEQLIRDKLIVPVDVELVPPGTLPRFEMKSQPLRRVYEENQPGIQMTVK
jgi:phenylacetate-CoA ligase